MGKLEIEDFKVAFPAHAGRNHIGADMRYGHEPWTGLNDKGAFGAGFSHYQVITSLSRDLPPVKFKHPYEQSIADRCYFPATHIMPRR